MNWLTEAIKEQREVRIKRECWHKYSGYLDTEALNGRWLPSVHIGDDVTLRSVPDGWLTWVKAEDLQPTYVKGIGMSWIEEAIRNETPYRVVGDPGVVWRIEYVCMKDGDEVACVKLVEVGGVRWRHATPTDLFHAAEREEPKANPLKRYRIMFKGRPDVILEAEEWKLDVRYYKFFKEGEAMAWFERSSVVGLFET